MDSSYSKKKEKEGQDLFRLSIPILLSSKYTSLQSSNQISYITREDLNSTIGITHGKENRVCI